VIDSELFDNARRGRSRKRLIEASVGSIEIEFLGERWGVVTLFGPDGHVHQQLTFNDRLRGLGNERGLARTLRKIGWTPTDRDNPEQIWSEMSAPTDWPPPTCFMGVLAYLVLLLLGLVVVAWGAWKVLF
jgi:hypothetical protein